MKLLIQWGPIDVFCVALGMFRDSFEARNISSRISFCVNEYENLNSENEFLQTKEHPKHGFEILELSFIEISLVVHSSVHENGNQYIFKMDHRSKPRFQLRTSKQWIEKKAFDDFHF